MNTVTLIPAQGCRGWSFRKGAWQHDTNRFFSVHPSPHGAHWIRQPGRGILGWLFRQNEDGGEFLVQHKFEPGNVRKTMWTCTVQATDSNLERVHGGREVWYADWFSNPKQWGTLETEDGGVYLGKYNWNCFRDVTDHPEIDAAPNCHWHPTGDVLNVALRNTLITEDALSALAASPWRCWIPRRYDTPLQRAFFADLPNDAPGKSDPEYPPKAAKELPEVANDFTPVFCRVHSPAREVMEWDQPLLETRRLEHHTLPVYWEEGEPLCCGFATASEPGLLTQQLSPGGVSAGRILSDTLQCNEGGRFYRRLARYSIVQVPELDENLIWMTTRSISESSGTFNQSARSLLALLLATVARDSP